MVNIQLTMFFTFFRGNVPVEERPEVCEEMEEQRWVPGAMNDTDLDKCLQIARSLAAINGLYDGGSTMHGCNAASLDDVAINALEVVSF